MVEALARKKGRRECRGENKREKSVYLTVFLDEEEEILVFARCWRMLMQEVGRISAQVGPVVE